MSEIIGYNDRVILDQYGASIGGGDGSRSSRPTCSASDTPRTEIYVLNPQPEAVPAEFARELERELTRVLRQRQDYCDILAKIRRAFRDFDNAREEAQFPGRYRPREKDADDLIENVRQILQNAKMEARTNGDD